MHDAVSDQVGEHPFKEETVSIDLAGGLGLILDKLKVILPGKPVI